MDELVNKLGMIQNGIASSKIALELVDDRVKITGPGRSSWFRVIRLYRPSSSDVLQAASGDALLVLSSPTVKATEAAARHNHVTLPDGSFRLIAPGMAIVREALPVLAKKPQRTKLTGRTGVVAETLLLGGSRSWSVHELAVAARISGALAHRVLARLEAEDVIESQGTGRSKTRAVKDSAVLAELWSQEEQPPTPLLRGHLYGPTPEAIVQKALQMWPGGAVGGVLAANLYQPVLTRTPYPVRLWVPEAFTLVSLRGTALEETVEGANIELLQAKGDPWQTNSQTLRNPRYREISNPMETSNLMEIPKVSGWRAWMEISKATGRSRELADELLRHLSTNM